jgi:PAS domain S-box-containing protein
MFKAGDRVLAGRVAADAPRRGATVARGRSIVGRVIVGVPLDDARLAHLEGDADLGTHQRLLAIQGGRVIAGPTTGAIDGGVPSVGDLHVDDTRYRVATARVVDGLRLATGEPRHFVSASEARARRRVLLAGLAILGGVALVAYALAPALSRTRVTQTQRAQAQQVLSHVGDGVFLVDNTGTISFWNPGAEATTGLPAAAALKRKPEEIFRRWRQHAPRPTPLDERPSAQTGQYEVNGTELWLSVSGVDSPIGTVYAFRDRTEEYRLEEARADFVATVSHELRTPLASIHGAANTLRSRDEHLRPATRRELLEIVFEQSERLHGLVDQILLANQLSSGSAHVERRSFDAARIARDTVNGVRPALPATVELELHVPDTLPPAIGDPERVRQVLVNLVENASKYSPGGGRIEIALAETDGHVRFDVRDEGLGIPRAEQERIFQKFYRLDAGMSRGIGGSGLGLFISRELVSLMDGRLSVNSEPGIGSTFSFELPTAAPPSTALGATGA